MISYNAGDLHPRKKPKQPSTQKQKTRLAMSLDTSIRRPEVGWQKDRQPWTVAQHAA
jgi:hypothetical protein